MSGFLPHEKLNVYAEALLFVRGILPRVETWPRLHAVCDQMERAAESVLSNLAVAARMRRTDKGIYHIECSLGSVLECAACLDVACLKGLIDDMGLRTGKETLQRIARMEIGLHKSWCDAVREDGTPYGKELCPYFCHESLDVYQRSLELCRVLEAGILSAENRRLRHAKRIDASATSLVLNIAEGNGRYSRLDHGNFVGISQNAITQLSVYLDLIEPGDSSDIERAKVLLRRIAAMLAGLGGYLHQDEIK